MATSTRESPGELLARRFRVQAAGCAHLGSPLYAALMERCARNVEESGLLLDLLAGWAHLDGPSALALRLFGAVHRLVLTGRAPSLAAFYPSAGGKEDAGTDGDRAWPLFLEAVEDNRGYCCSAMEHPPQTNEVGRSAALVVGFVKALALSGRPLSVLEVGASAGLNLYWDSFSYGKGDGAWMGDPTSPVRFPSSWYPDGLESLVGGTGAARLADMPAVVSRAACDRSPVDVSCDDGALTLMSYVWPDQRERFTRLTGAIDVARRAPVAVEAAGALEWLTARLREPVQGACTVVFHSIVLQYISGNDKNAILECLQEAGRRATVDSPLAWLRLEPAQTRRVSPMLAEVRLTFWPGGGETVVADAGFHGRPVLVPR